MENPQQCLLGVARVKRVFLCLGFGLLVLWILFGNYYIADGRQSVKMRKKARTIEVSNGIFRKLMEAGEVQDQFDPNSSNKDVECSSIHEYNESVFCDFVRKVPSCGGDDGFVPYFDFVYCAMPYSLVPLSMIILTFWLLYLFMFLGTTAESFFCRELTFITRLLRLSQNVAGVTLLAIGNGAPDIFSAIAAFTHPDPKRSSLAFGALFGAGMFVTNIVAGLVCIFHPFRTTRRPFLRDNIYYLFAVYWILYLLWDKNITLVIAIGLLLYYLSYVLVVVLGSVIYQRWVKWQAKRLEEQRLAVQFKKNEGSEQDSLGQSQTGRVILGDDTSSDMEREQPPLKISQIKSGDEETLPVVVVTKATSQDYDSDSSRPKTPTERSALRASQIVYGSSDQGEPPTRRRRIPYTPSDEVEDQGETPRPRSRLEQVIDNAVYIAEDMIATNNPNLAKLWHNEYEKEMRREKEGSQRTTPYFSTTAVTPRIDEETSFQKYQASSSSSSEEEDEEETKEKLVEDEQSLSEDTPLLRPGVESLHPGKKLLKALFPFTENRFKSKSFFGKIFTVIRYPLTLILTLTIPVVDVDEPINNWNKWLTVIQCMTAPVFVSITTEFGLKRIGGVFPVVIIVFVASIGLAVIVALTSSNNKPPLYHCIFAWVGFTLSVLWIYTIANEIVNLLQVFGVVVQLSDGILGITLLAWGNSIQDSVTNVTMARQGFPRMAIGACFGGPLLNILIGIGLASLIRTLEEPGNKFTIYLTQVTMLAAFFLIFSLVVSLVVISCLQFRMHRLYGIFLFLFYLVFLVVMILAEIRVFNISIDGTLSVID